MDRFGQVYGQGMFVLNIQLQPLIFEQYEYASELILTLLPNIYSPFDNPIVNYNQLKQQYIIKEMQMQHQRPVYPSLNLTRALKNQQILDISGEGRQNYQKENGKPIKFRNNSNSSLISQQNLQQYFQMQQINSTNLQADTQSNKNLSTYRSIPLIEVISKNQFEQLYRTIVDQTQIDKKKYFYHGLETRQAQQEYGKLQKQRNIKLQLPIRRFWRYSPEQDYKHQVMGENHDHLVQGCRKDSQSYYQQLIRWKEGKYQNMKTASQIVSQVKNSTLNDFKDQNSRGNYPDYKSGSNNYNSKHKDMKNSKERQSQQQNTLGNSPIDKKYYQTLKIQLQNDQKVCSKDYMLSRMRIVENQYKQKIKQLVGKRTNDFDIVVPNGQNTNQSHEILDNTKNNFPSKNNINQSGGPVLISRQMQTFQEQMFEKLEAGVKQPKKNIKSQTQYAQIDRISFQHLINRPPTYLNMGQIYNGKGITKFQNSVNQQLIQSQGHFLNQNQAQQEIKKQLIQLYANAPISLSDHQKKQQSLQRQLKQSHYQQKKSFKPKVKLNIEKLIKLNAKQFLLFYSQNYRKIINLSTPEQLKRLNHYRQKCLEKQNSIQKLRKAIRQKGEDFINKLSSDQKQKMFRVLYGDYPQFQQEV